MYDFAWCSRFSMKSALFPCDILYLVDTIDKPYCEMATAQAFASVSTMRA
jgi:hypothetical protein